MEKSQEKSKFSGSAAFRREFWEAWLLVALLVTILGAFAQSRQFGLSANASSVHNQFDPYDIRPEIDARGGRALESGF
ncbi:MAG: hypothetical protein NDI61_02330 [Bdellovibrionaceae bacterium]|nr:hypothetical protein [Pseudobdellovibrionaceae bacterium]